MNRNWLRSWLWMLVFLLAATGCHRSPRGVATAPPPTPPAAVADALPVALMEAESAFDSGDFLIAAVSYEFYFQSDPQSNEMDRIRFRYGVAQSLSGVTSLEAASNDTFRQLIREYPESPFAPPARVALELQADIVRLQAEKISRDDRIRQLTALLPPAPPVVPAVLQEAESEFDTADFAKAAKSYEAYLQSKPETDEMDRVLLKLGVAQSMSGVTAREAASNDTFNKLISEFPNSPYALAARRVIALRKDIQRLQNDDRKAKDDKIQKLTDELNNLKKIDSDRPRRTP